MSISKFNFWVHSGMKSNNFPILHYVMSFVLFHYLFTAKEILLRFFCLWEDWVSGLYILFKHITRMSRQFWVASKPVVSVISWRIEDIVFVFEMADKGWTEDPSVCGGSIFQMPTLFWKFDGRNAITMSFLQVLMALLSVFHHTERMGWSHRLSDLKD